MDRSATLERDDWLKILGLIATKCERERDMDEVFRWLDIYEKLYNQTLVYDFSK